MYRRLLSDEECTALEVQIVCEFGNGALEPGKYVWEQVLADRGFFVPVSEAMKMLPEDDLFVLLERHPNNDWDAEKVANMLGAPGKRGFVVNKDAAREILLAEPCDVFVTNQKGNLLLLGCHEDRIENGERILWATPHTRLLVLKPKKKQKAKYRSIDARVKANKLS